jgi:hypothetical protein
MISISHISFFFQCTININVVPLHIMLSRQALGDILYTTRTSVYTVEIDQVVQHDYLTANNALTLMNSTPNTITTFDAGYNLASKDIESMILPTVNRVNVTLTNNNEVTLATPQGIGQTSQVTFDGMHLTTTQNATSSNTGTLIIDGGIGVGQDIHVGGNLYDANGLVDPKYGGGPQYALQYNNTGLFGGSAQYTIDNSVLTESQLKITSPDSTLTTGIISDQNNNTSRLTSNANDVEIWSQNNKSININNGNLTIFPNGGSGSTVAADGDGGIIVMGTMESTSMTSGALKILGGIGIGGSLTAGAFSSNDNCLNVETDSVEQKVYWKSGTAGIFRTIYFTPSNTGFLTAYAMYSTTVQAYSTYESTSPSSGALVVNGGASVGGRMYIGGTSAATSMSTGCLVLSDGAGLGGAVYIGSALNSSSVNTGGLLVEGGISVKGITNVGGSLTVNGSINATEIRVPGVRVVPSYFQSGQSGIFRDIYYTPVGLSTPNPYIFGASLLTVNVPTTITSTAASTSSATGSLMVRGGVGIYDTVNIGSGNVSTSTSTGGMVITGGIGLSGDLYSGSGIYPGNNNIGFSAYYTDVFTYTPISGTFNGVTLTFAFTRMDTLVFCAIMTAMTTGAGGNAYFSVTSTQLGTGSGGNTYTAIYAPNIGRESYVTGVVHAAGSYVQNSTYFANAQINVYADTATSNFNNLPNNGLVKQTLIYRML